MAKRAVLIGINEYAMPGANLRGCVNDVRNMQTMLSEVFGFADGDITTLEDSAATQDAMKDAITNLVGGAMAGDALLLHYSGHGSQVADLNGDEKDGRDEILCPHDLDWNAPFLDDWMRTALDKLPTEAHLTVIMDCCHSGTNSREPMPPDAPSIPRYLANPNLEDVDQDLRDAGGDQPKTKRAARRGSADQHVVDICETLVSGCRDDQTSADARIDNTYNGALTYYLVKAVRELGPQASFRQIHSRTLALLQGHYPQVPQLEGRAANLDRPFLLI